MVNTEIRKTSFLKEWDCVRLQKAGAELINIIKSSKKNFDNNI